MSVRLTPAFTSPFSAEEEVSWGSQPPVCLLGQECPGLAHPLLLRVSLSSAPWQHPYSWLPGPHWQPATGISCSLRQSILRSGAGNLRY